MPRDGADLLLGPAWDSNGVFIGAVSVGRICYDHRGRRLKVLSQGSGTTLVKRRCDDEYETIPISPESVVYTRRLKGVKS